jgi:23S rRNA pseudouridine1911/1915/1917 synthase
MPKELCFEIPHDAPPQRLDQFLASQIPEHSRSQIKRIIETGAVRVNAAVAKKAGLTLEPGAKIRVELPEVQKMELTARQVPLEIVFEDDHLAVVYKPPGVSVHPSHTENADTMVHGLLYALKTLSSVGGIERPGIVHRLDKGTSGLLVVSKTDLTHLALAAQFKARRVQRSYLGLVHGDLAKKLKSHGPELRIETFFGRHPKNRKKMTGLIESGKKAITNVKILEAFGPLTLVECRLETGRTHQIRVHLSELGFPLVGDSTYGPTENLCKELARGKGKWREISKRCSALTHQLLHAQSLGFEHPVTESPMFFQHPPPAEFTEILEMLRK